jgi:hypothetical protein
MSIPPDPIIHLLHEGLAVCGFPGIPRDWPERTAWLSLADWPAKSDTRRREELLLCHGAHLCSECDRRASASEGIKAAGVELGQSQLGQSTDQVPR